MLQKVKRVGINWENYGLLSCCYLKEDLWRNRVSALEMDRLRYVWFSQIKRKHLMQLKLKQFCRNSGGMTSMNHTPGIWETCTYTRICIDSMAIVNFHENSKKIPVKKDVRHGKSWCLTQPQEQPLARPTGPLAIHGCFHHSSGAQWSSGLVHQALEMISRGKALTPCIM